MAGVTWSEEEIQVAVQNYPILDKHELMKLLPGRSWESIKVKAQRSGVLREPPWTEDEEQIMVNHYATMPKPELLAALPLRTWSTVVQKARRLKLNRPRTHYKIDKDYHTFFDVIDTKAKAYVLGYFVADGCITYIPQKGIYVLSFSSNDPQLLEIVKREMGLEHEIKNGGAARPDQYCIQVGSKYLVNRLMDMGFDNDKSHTAIMPEISEEFYSDFARGLLDGDGCITRTKDGNRYYLMAHFNGTYLLLESLAKVLPTNVASIKECSGNVYRISLSFKKAMTVLDWLYEDSEGLRLDRKYIRYLESKTHTGFYADA